MTDWSCGIMGCGADFPALEDLLRHQVTDHGSCECAVCGETHPEGFLAIRHAFSEHNRAEYVRAYDADSDDIRVRERIAELIEQEVDVPAFLKQLEADVEQPAVSAGD